MRERGLLRADLAALAVGHLDRRSGSHIEGDADVRRSRYEAASGLMTRFKGRDKVRAGAKRSPNAPATARPVAVARKLAVIMHAMWSDGTLYVGDSAANRSDAARRAHIKDRRLLGAHR